MLSGSAGSVDLRAFHREVDSLVQTVLATEDPDEKVALFATLATCLANHLAGAPARSRVIEQAVADMMDLDVQSEPFRAALVNLRDVASLARCGRCNE